MIVRGTLDLFLGASCRIVEGHSNMSPSLAGGSNVSTLPDHGFKNGE